MKIVTDDNIYFAKATFPVGNSWRSDWMTKEKAIAKAKWFVAEWFANGLSTAEAAVFYRDGSLVATFRREFAK